MERLNDIFEENSGKVIQEVKSGKEEYDNNNRCYFFALDESRCSVLSAASEVLVKKFDYIWVGVNNIRSTGSKMIYREFNQMLNIPSRYQLMLFSHH